MRKVYSRIKSLDLENKRGFIEKINQDDKKDFFFNEQSLKDTKFEKLKEMQFVEFESNITENGNYANNIHTRIKSVIKSLNYENKTGIIEKISQDDEKDFFFNEKNLEGIEFEKLKKGDKVKFLPNITEKGNYANKVEIITELLKSTSAIELQKDNLTNNLVQSLSIEFKKILLAKLENITNPSEFEDYCFTILKLLGVETIYQYPREAQAGRADGIFKLKTLEVIYDCTLRENFKEYKEDQIQNFISKIRQSKITVGKSVLSLSPNSQKQIWIITKKETRLIFEQDDIKVLEVNIKDLINIYETKIRELEYTRLLDDFIKLSSK